MTISNAHLKGEITTIQLALATLIALHPDQEKIVSAIRNLTEQLLSNLPEIESTDFADGIQSSLKGLTTSPL